MGDRPIPPPPSASAPVYFSWESDPEFTEGLPFVLCRADDQGRVFFLSPNVERITGYSADTFFEAEADFWRDRIDEADRPAVVEAFARQFKEGRGGEVEFRFRRRNGEIAWFGGIGLFRTTEADRSYVTWVFNDISARKRAEEGLRRRISQSAAMTNLSHAIFSGDWSMKAISRDTLHTALEQTGSLHGLVSIVDPVTEEKVGYALDKESGDERNPNREIEKFAVQTGPDPRYGRLMGYALNLGQSFYTNDPKNHSARKDAPEADGPIQRFLAAPAKIGERVLGVVALADAPQDYGDGDLRFIERVADLLALAIQRVRDQQRVQESETRFRMFSQLSSEGIALTEKGVLTDVNEAFLRMFGVRAEEVIGESPMKLLHPDSQETVLRHIQEGYEKPYEQTAIRSDGATFPMESEARQINLEGRSIRVTLVRDLTLKRQAEFDRQENTRRLEEAAILGKLGVWEFNLVDQSIFWSDQLYRIYRRDPALGPPSVEEEARYYDEAAQHRLQELARIAIEERRSQEYFFDARLPDGSLIHLTGYMRPMVGVGKKVQSLFGLVQDVTERTRHHEEMNKAQKLESVGLLAGGIAHDFNNLLMVMLGNLQLAQLALEDNTPAHHVRDLLGESIIACQRAGGLTKQLLTFSRGGSPVLENASILDLVRESAQFSLRGSNVSYSLSHPDKVWPVRVDTGQISQVLNNIIINADQAMPEGGEVKIIISNLRLESPNERPIGEAPDDPPSNRFVRIVIRDTGAGVKAEHLQKIFDPYFTTKRKGSGLGLATSHSIIRKHGGSLKCEPTLGEGAAFVLLLPASDEEALQAAKTAEGRYVGKGRILAMDDEEPVCRLLEMQLRKMGFDPTISLNGEKAVELYRQSFDEGRPFDLVILDLTVAGGMGGKAALDRMKKIDPNVKAMVASGYSNDEILANPHEYGFIAALMKPYDRSELERKLRFALGDASQPDD